MPSQDFIKELHLDENSFVLNGDTEMSYLEHFAAPFTGSGKCVIPKGTIFTPHGFMRDDAIYLHTEYDEDLDATIKKKIEEKYSQIHPGLINRYQGASFYITEEQLRNPSLTFISGSLARLLEIFEVCRKEDERNSLTEEEYWEKEFGNSSVSKKHEMQDYGKPKHIKYKPSFCPECGSKNLRPVHWGKITQEVQRLKDEHKIFIGEQLYGTGDKDYSKKHEYSFVQAPMPHVDYACGECGASFIQDNKHISFGAEITNLFKRIFKQ